MAILQTDYKNKRSEIIQDEHQKLYLQNAKQQYKSRNEKINQYFSDIELAKNRAALTKWKAIENLDKYLIEFEANCIKAGIKVLWALNWEQAHEELATVIQRHEIKNITKDEGFLFDEIEWDNFVAKNNVAQSHLREPNHHSIKSFVQTDVSKQNKDASANSYALIQQANFIAADTGSVMVAEHAAHAATNFITPSVRIMLSGIDHLLPSIHDLELFAALQAAYTTDNGMYAFNKIISSGVNNGNHGCDMYVMLIDNGRSNVLESELHRQLLYCIQCGACQAACPVMHSIGSSNCNSVYSGPVGFAALPYWKGQKEFSHLSYSSPLCGKCNDVCPVKIDFKKSMLALRNETVKRKQNPQQEKLFYYIWKKTMLKRELIGWKKINTYRYAVDAVFLKSKEGLRSLPTSATKSFNQQWRERNGLK